MDAKDEIKQKLELSELIAEYTEVKPSGSHSLKAICPFHNEKTPSLHISSDKQVWHCFGCGAGGDLFSFFMQMEGCEFPEALRQLGAKAGVEVKRFSSKESGERQRLVEMNELAAKYYRKVLMDSPKAAAARDYATSRNILPKTAEQFGIGYAPEEWDGLCQFLASRGYRNQEMVKAGLALNRKSGSGVIDRFRHRLMIPLRSHHGAVVGFTGRQMPGSDDGPKYMNSPETPIYKKGELLYGLDLAKRAIKDAGAVVIVEGQMDVIASHQIEVAQVVASSGTALTEMQIELLKRYAPKIIFCFDQDAAGYNAAKKGIALAREAGLDVRAIVLEGVTGKDPDEVIAKDPDVWKHAVEESQPIMQFLIRHLTDGKDLTDIDVKRAVSAELLPELGRISEVVEREHWLQKLATLFQVDVAILRSALPKHRPASQDGGKVITPQPSALKRNEIRVDKSSLLLIGLCLVSDDYANTILTQLDFEWLVGEHTRRLYKDLKSLYASAQNLAQKSIFDRLRVSFESDPEQEVLQLLLDKALLIAEELNTSMPAPKVREQIKTLLTRLSRQYVAQRRKMLGAAIAQAEADGDTARVQALLQEVNSL